MDNILQAFKYFLQSFLCNSPFFIPNYSFRDGEDVMVDNLQLEDAKEGLNSFVEKRHPKFTDKWIIRSINCKEK